MKAKIIRAADVCTVVAQTSDDFEKNTSIKKQYISYNINFINCIMQSIPGYLGSFGTGYPFYALENRLKGVLPIINEQLRYNNELLNYGNDEEWACYECLQTNGFLMPNIKEICKKCTKTPNNIKPRKVLNRLPDIDMWMICKEENIEEISKTLELLLTKYGFRTSDVDPIRTINDLVQITERLKQGKMPKKTLPIDIHIIGYQSLITSIQEIPLALSKWPNNNPYVPIHPLSLRKSWQYDDVPYNFVLDFLLSLTPFNWNDELYQTLIQVRKYISEKYSNEELMTMMLNSGPESVKRKFETPKLKTNYIRRINSWKK